MQPWFLWRPGLARGQLWGVSLQQQHWLGRPQRLRRSDGRMSTLPPQHDGTTLPRLQTWLLRQRPGPGLQRFITILITIKLFSYSTFYTKRCNAMSIHFLALGRLPVGCAQKTFTGRHPEGIRIRFWTTSTDSFQLGRAVVLLLLHHPPSHSFGHYWNTGLMSIPTPAWCLPHWATLDKERVQLLSSSLVPELVLCI